MTSTATFVTTTGHTGAWPDPPTYWSYSSLAEVESCPRRWGLRHATYPDLWGRHGYPDRVSEPSIVGAAVHQGVEEILRAFRAAGCSSIGDTQAVDALRTLGGFTAIAAAAGETVLRELEDNPRMRPHLPRLRHRLQRRTPEMRRAVQTLVSRMSLVSEELLAVGTEEGPDAERSRIGSGMHPEVNLRAEAQRFIGRVDLLTVHSEQADILDFKSGQAADGHREQVKLYGLLWMLDGVANPERLPVGSLTVAYVDHEESVPLPDWDALRSELEERIEAADRAVGAVPPTAIPSPDCWHCPVRQMCEEYWESPYVTREPEARFGDAELTLLELSGPKSWSTRYTGSDRKTLLRTTEEADGFEVGQRLRILDAAIEEGRDEDWTVVTLNANSEVFRADLHSPT